MEEPFPYYAIYVQDYHQNLILHIRHQTNKGPYVFNV